jgi:hypothetical protein
MEREQDRRAKAYLVHSGQLHLELRARDLALFNLAIDSKFARMRSRRHRASMMWRLTAAQSTAPTWPRQVLFPGRGGPERSLTTRQYARLVERWVVSVGLDPRKFATHSIRRTKPTLIYRRTGNLRMVELLRTRIERIRTLPRR